MSNEYSFILDKLPAKLENKLVQYYLPYQDKLLLINQLIGTSIELKFTGKLQCLDCGKIVKKFYSPGLCYVCTMSSPMNSECIVRPELCEAHLGKGKVPKWEESHHNQPHIVYLANSGGLKVGVTRTDQIPTRWIDQGADEAIILARTPYRQIAGLIEVALKDHLSDKTNWRAMLKNDINKDIKLLEAKYQYAELLDKMNSSFSEFISEDDQVYSLEFPTTIISNPINSQKLDKQPEISGILTGIKGQYLIFDQKNVINMRSHGGYEVILKTEDGISLH